MGIKKNCQTSWHKQKHSLENVEKIKKELSISADYTVGEDSSFIVNLKAIENNTILIDLNVSVPSKTEAKAICNKWENNSSDIYNKIIHALIED